MMMKTLEFSELFFRGVKVLFFEALNRLSACKPKENYLWELEQVR
jgi:hypothetical protein